MYTLLLLLAVAAPIPAPKTHLSRGQIIGDWDVKWGYSDCRATFKEDGNYWCSCLSKTYVGGWWMKDGFLYVEEREVNNDNSLGSKSEWKVNLQRTGKYFTGSYGTTVIFMYRR